jgi:hypothetical protein
MKTVTLRGKDGLDTEVPGEVTAVAGLFITPQFNATSGMWSGTWALTHGPSGRCHPYYAPSPARLRDLARRLAEVHADWTELDESPKNWPDEIRERVIAVTVEFSIEQDEEEMQGAW